MKSFVDGLRFLVMDVDGTLTDGGVYIGESGEVFKSFDVKDGCGIKLLLPKLDIVPVVITARKSSFLERRCQELGIGELHQGVSDKLERLNDVIAEHALMDRLSYSLESVVYIGDDIVDLPCMEAVKQAGGLVACPSDAVGSIIKIAGFVCTKPGGKGAVRELIDWIAKVRSVDNLSMIEGVSAVAHEFINSFNPSLIEDGSYEIGEGIFANVMSYSTVDPILTCCESHTKHIDVQFMVYGKELMVVEQSERLRNRIVSSYDETRDTTLYESFSGRRIELDAGDSIILYPEDAHRGAIVNNSSTHVKKVVVKIPVDVA